MNDGILVINSGSSSIKFALFEAASPSAAALQGAITSLDGRPAFSARDRAGNALAGELNAAGMSPPAAMTHESALAWLFDWLSVQAGGRLIGAGHRVVHGGEHFAEPVLIDAGVLAQLVVARADGKVIVAHLGNGASLCAMRNRKSIATTMGFTPLDGLMMGTRSGAIDPGVLFYLMREKGMSPEQVEDLLYRRSGLLGVSAVSSDMRELLASSAPAAQEAVALFCYRAVRETGSLIAALGGLDALVFTAGIGERAHEIRARICEGLSWMGVALDDGANRTHQTTISKAQSRVTVSVIPANEEAVIARHTVRVAGTSH